LVLGLKSGRGSHIDHEESGTIVNAQEQPIHNLENAKKHARNEPSEDFKILHEKHDSFASLQGLTLESIKLTPEKCMQRKGGLGKIFFSEHKGFPVCNLLM
jgi:Protein tyrosine and serine/threonine kinase